MEGVNVIKCKRFYLRALLFVIPILYSCSMPPAPLPVPIQKPKAKITVPRPIFSRLDNYKVRRWKYIIIHHSAIDKGSAYSIDRYHREDRGWRNGLGYHFVIGNGNGARNGQIEMGGRWRKQMKGAHAGNHEYNQYGIGICLIGNFENKRPSEAQLSALADLIKYLQKRCNIPTRKVFRHKDVKITVCPGDHFPYYELMARLR